MNERVVLEILGVYMGQPLALTYGQLNHRAWN